MSVRLRGSSRGRASRAAAGPARGRRDPGRAAAGSAPAAAPSARASAAGPGRAAGRSCFDRRGADGGVALGAERLVEPLLELTALVELLDDVGTADELALDEHLR